MPTKTKHRIFEDDQRGTFTVFCSAKNDKIELIQSPKYCPMCGEGLEEGEGNKSCTSSTP